MITVHDPKRFGRVAVLMGGSSSEREVSLDSGSNVLAALQTQGVDAFAVDGIPALVSLLVDKKVDRVFNILHGNKGGGEDGVLQGLLEAFGVPYTGSDVLGSSLSMDKIRTKQIWLSLGLSTPRYARLVPGADVAAAARDLGLPVIVKPSCEGSSVGISRVFKAEDLQAAVDLAAWTSWARRCRLEPFKKLAATIKERFGAVVRGMLDHRSNAFVESMNGQLQHAKRAARGYRTAKNFIAIADTGDNGGVRGELAIHIFEEPAQLVAGQHLKPYRSLRFVWPDGPRDAEALMADTETRQFLLVSKKRVPAELYALSFDAEDGSSPTVIGRFEDISQPDAATMNTKSDYGRYRAQITAADLSPDRKTIALLNYQQINFFELPNAKHPNITPLHTLTLPWLPQAESIAYSEDGNSLFVGGEQAPSPIIRFDRLTP